MFNFLKRDKQLVAVVRAVTLLTDWNNYECSHFYYLFEDKNGNRSVKIKSSFSIEYAKEHGTYMKHIVPWKMGGDNGYIHTYKEIKFGEKKVFTNYK